MHDILGAISTLFTRSENFTTPEDLFLIQNSSNGLVRIKATS